MIHRLSVALVLMILLGFIPPAHADDTTLLITWKANTYVPADFTGKAFPTANSEIAVSVALIANGKVVDLSNQTINWYRDDNFWKGGRGLTSIALRAPEVPNSIIEVRAEVPGYAGGPINTIVIPVKAPQAVIASSYPYKKFGDSETVFYARPYFFNVKSADELSIGWKANGEAPKSSEDPHVFKVNILPNTPSNFSLGLNLIIRNPAQFLERAEGVLSLNYEPR